MVLPPSTVLNSETRSRSTSIRGSENFIAIAANKQYSHAPRALARPLPEVSVMVKSSIFLAGFCLMENGKILVEPQCCADFSDVGRWETLADFKAPEWSRPYFQQRFHSPLVRTSPACRAATQRQCLARARHDTDTLPRRPLKGASILSVPVAALRRALDEAKQVMTAIEARLDQALIRSSTRPLARGRR